MLRRTTPPTRAASPRGFNPLGRIVEFSRDPFAFVFRHASRFAGFYRARFLTRYVYFVHRPELLQALSLPQREYLTKAEQLRHLIGDGLLSSDGDLWLTERRVAQRSFHPDQLDRYAVLIADSVTHAVGSWRDGVLQAQRELYPLTVEVVCRTLFGITEGVDFRGLDAILQEASQALLPAQQGVALLFGREGRAQRRFRAAMARVHEAVDRLIETYTDARQGDTYLGCLMHRFRAGQIDRQLLRDHLHTFLFAGQESTALSLSYALHLLAHHPAVQDQLRAEALAADWPIRRLTDLDALPVAVSVAKETLRLFPPVWLLPRVAARACPVDGVEIEAGSPVNLLALVVHRDAAYYPDPDAFKPERWTEAFEQSLPKGAYLPFGLGPRRCIGDRMAMIEMAAVLGETVRRFEIRPDGPAHITYEPLLTLRPTRAITVALASRPPLASPQAPQTPDAHAAQAPAASRCPYATIS
jgi:cytochrome P450